MPLSPLKQGRALRLVSFALGVQENGPVMVLRVAPGKEVLEVLAKGVQCLFARSLVRHDRLPPDQDDL